MKKHIISIFIITSIVSLHSATLTTLTAKQATGGALIKTNLNDSAVYFPAVNPANNRIVWTLPSTLPGGLYQLDIDIYQGAGVSFSIWEKISFEAAGAVQLGVLDFHDFSMPSGTYTKSVGFYSPNILSTIALIKSAQTNLNTFGIRAIRISAGTEAGMGTIPFTFQLPVTGTKVAVPIPLPLGSYQVTATVATATSWTTPAGVVVNAPASKLNRIYINQGAQPAIVSGGPVTAMSILHLPTPVPPNMSTAGVAPLFTIADTTNIETRTLKLIGYTGTGLPQLDIFPDGKKLAVVSSWDDGSASDLPLMDSLVQYGIKGSFMMYAGSALITKLSQFEAKGMEIGGHSWSHPAFYLSSPQRCMDEAIESRRLLESKLGHPVISFAYPYDYSPAYDQNGEYVLRSIRAAGYWFGRSTGTGTVLGTVDAMSEPLAMIPAAHFTVGLAAVKAKFDAMLLIPGSVFHIWGHSNELATSMVTFRSCMAYIANNPTAWYTTLGDLMVWKYTRKQLRIEPNLTAVGDKTCTLKMPWLHPYLRKVPVSLTLPTGVTAVEWQGVQYPVVNNRVQLLWGAPVLTENTIQTSPRKCQIRTFNNIVKVMNISNGQVVKVYLLSGVELASKVVDNDSSVSFELGSGVYLVRVGEETHKVVV